MTEIAARLLRPRESLHLVLLVVASLIRTSALLG